ncbi:Zn-dependent hydrolase [Sedimentitalea sp. XS_ASV28]|uniref:Zn-dependent hydrolase n=1 Tax=Sedimentitalea sp. XS_ASV28 TaxID=3241296 RepID=UPI0035143B26
MRRNLTVNGDRLWQRHMALAEIGPVGETGNCRLSMSKEDGAARDLFARWCRDAGLSVQSDRAGNMVAIRPGTDPDRGLVAAGSHLDTQPHGGRFDGISGVLAALEAIETLNDAGIETKAPLAVINWTNEEGVRFAPGLMGSSWFVGELTDDALDASTASDGTTFAAEAEKIGWRGELRPDAVEMDSFFELHIEQGPVLERAGVQVGIVTSVQGLRWLDVIVTGMDAHAGTTPLDARRDALLAAAAAVQAINCEGRREGADARVSVGRFLPATDGPSTIVGEVRFVIDIRHPDNAVLGRLEAACKRASIEAADRYGCVATVTRRIAVPPRDFDAGCIDAVQQAADALGFSNMQLPSGALHDASNIAAIAPTSMIFVPCRNGISHNIDEYASPEDLAAGCNVLLHSMLSRAG